MSPRKCPECGVMFEPQYRTQVCCCMAHQRQRAKRLERETWNHLYGAGTGLRALRRQRVQLKTTRNNRLRALDAEYAKLDVPVTTRVAANGRIIEVRGQPHFGSCCGTLGGMDAEIARRYL